MRTSVKVVLGLLLVFVPLQAAAQGVGYNFIRFDVDSATMTYGILRGESNSAFGGTIRGPSNIETVGSTVTVTGVSPTTTAAFADIAVGDIIQVTRPDGTTDNRFVATRASSDSITVDTAINWQNGTTGFVFRYYKATTCTDATCGWIDVSTQRTTTLAPMMCAQWERGDFATGVEVVFECRGAGIDAGPIQVFPAPPGTFTALALANVGTTGARQCISLDIVKFKECRVGVRGAGADTADVVGTTTELFGAWVEK